MSLAVLLYSLAPCALDIEWYQVKSRIPPNYVPTFRHLSLKAYWLLYVLPRFIATRYGLDCPGFEPRWGRALPYPYRPPIGPTHPPVQWVPGFFPVGKATEG